jgi:hypothetical protein
MDLSHLSDEQIQNYLDKSDSINQAEIERHLHQCLYCTRNLHIYQGIYRQLSQDAVPDLSKKFSGLVLSRIKRSQDEKTNFWENILFIVLVVLGAVGSSYLINPLPVLKSMIEPLYDILARTIHIVPVQLNSTLILIAGGIVILIFYEFLNKRLLKSKS